MKLRLGQWVRVKPGCGWIGEPKGRVTEVFPSADQYLVTFHQSAQDGDGGGPYAAACLRGRDLQKIAAQGRKKAMPVVGRLDKRLTFRH